MKNQIVDDGIEHGGGKGIVREFGELPAEALVFKKALARLLGKSTITIDRMVRRGELPRPIRFTNQDVWTAGLLREHISKRLEEAARDRAKVQARISELSA